MPKKTRKQIFKETKYRGSNGKEYTPEEMELRRSIFFEPVDTKEELQAFLKVFFNIDLPDNPVDELSTSTPLNLIWQVYSTMRTNKGPKHHAVAASRNSSKTLCSAIIHFLAMIHYRRQCLHIASIKEQAIWCMKYMTSFCKLPEIIDHFECDNSQERRLVNLPPNSFTNKNNAEISIIAATLKGANSKRSNCLILDELDLTPREIIAEVAGVLDPTLDDHQFDPIVVSLSSRKSNDGPIQDDIDRAEAEIASGKPCTIKLHKFSVVDWMQKCTTSGNESGLLYVNENNLSLIWGKDQFDLLLTSERDGYKPYKIYENCKDCPALLACLGRSVQQKDTSSRLRKPEFIGTVLRTVKDPQVILAQYLNWKPETTGNVFRAFDPIKHTGNLLKAWTWCTGMLWPHAYAPTLATLATWLRVNDWYFVWGVDFGYSPDPAVCVVLAYDRKTERVIVLKSMRANNYSNEQWAKYCHEVMPDYLSPDMVCPDTQDAASPSYFRKFGFSARKQKPKHIATGVSQIRGFLWNPHDQSSHFMMVLDDSDPHIEGMRETIYEFIHWKHERTPLGAWDANRFEKGGDHGLDSCRYALDIFIQSHGKATVAIDRIEIQQRELIDSMNSNIPDAVKQTYANNGSPTAFDRQNEIALLTQAGYVNFADTIPTGEKPKKKSRIHFDMT